MWSILFIHDLSDNGYRIKSALNTLVNQVKCPEVHNKCLGCKAKGKVEVYQGTCFADDDDKINQGTCLACHEQSSFADGIGNDNVNVNGNANGNVNDIVNGNDNVNSNQGTYFADVNVNLGTRFAYVNDNQGTCFADLNGETRRTSHNNDKLLPSFSNDTYSDSDDTVWSVSHKYINIFSKTKQRDKPRSQCGCGGGILLV